MKSSKTSLRLNDWGISFDEYKELYHYCLQYHRKKADAAALLTMRISTPPPALDKDGNGVLLPHGSGGISDPVAATAAKRDRLLRDVDIIDRAAKLAGDDLAPYLLRAVTAKDGVNRVIIECPCGRRQFYAMRRRFFYILKTLRDDAYAPIQ